MPKKICCSWFFLGSSLLFSVEALTSRSVPSFLHWTVWILIAHPLRKLYKERRTIDQQSRFTYRESLPKFENTTTRDGFPIEYLYREYVECCSAKQVDNKLEVIRLIWHHPAGEIWTLPMEASVDHIIAKFAGEFSAERNFLEELKGIIETVGKMGRSLL